MYSRPYRDAATEDDTAMDNVDLPPTGMRPMEVAVDSSSPSSSSSLLFRIRWTPREILMGIVMIVALCLGFVKGTRLFHRYAGK